MSAREEIARLLKEAAADMKRDVKGAITKLEAAYALARDTPDDAAVVAEELARAWGRGRSAAKSLHYAILSTKLAPEERATWTTLGKTCELVASRMGKASEQRRARALFKGAAGAFKNAAALTKDAEDKRWLLELAGDAARQAKPPHP